MEAQLTRLSDSAATAGIRANLVCIVAMFRDYIATLDEAIQISKVELGNWPPCPTDDLLRPTELSLQASIGDETSALLPTSSEAVS